MVKIYRNVRIKCPRKMEIGAGTSIEEGNLFMSEGGIKIGNDVLIGPNCQLITHQHSFKKLNVPIYDQPTSYGKITIGDNVWVGAGVIVLPGISIGDNSVIGAGSVVNNDIPKNSIAVGVPAKVIRKRS